MKMHNIKIYSAFIWVFYIFTSCTAQMDVYDGFETTKLSKIWKKDRMVNAALTMQSAIVQKGHSAAMITLKTGDVYETGLGKDKDSERDELRESKKLASLEDKIYEYRFSFFLPGNFPLVPVRLVDRPVETIL